MLLALGAGPRAAWARPAPPAPPSSAEDLRALDADLALLLQRLQADYAGRRQALRSSAAPVPVKRRLGRGLRRRLSDEKARLRRQYRERRLALEHDARRGEDPFRRAEIRGLRAQLAEGERDLSDEYAFKRSARLRQLEGRPLSEDDRQYELRCLDIEYRLLQIALRDEFWEHRADMLRARGPDAYSRN